MKQREAEVPYAVQIAAAGVSKSDLIEALYDLVGASNCESAEDEVEVSKKFVEWLGENVECRSQGYSSTTGRSTGRMNPFAGYSKLAKAVKAALENLEGMR